jgi:hypothetical protein
MDEHDSICSTALHHMKINDLIHEYATLKLQNRKLLAVVNAAKVWAEPIKASSVMESSEKKSDKDSRLYAALKELERE